ncbi:hypothetical protein L2E81_19625 [Planktothrix agardhii 1033]|nr:hypothetical protein [Planktothrix agardhii 1033]
MHYALQRQLKRLGLDRQTPPVDIATWQEFLEVVNHSYNEADRERNLIERSLTLSSREMLELYNQQTQESEARLQAERDRAKRSCSFLLNRKHQLMMWWNSKTAEFLSYIPILPKWEKN